MCNYVNKKLKNKPKEFKRKTNHIDGHSNQTITWAVRNKNNSTEYNRGYLKSH